MADNMTKTTVARWQDWSGKGIEHLVLRHADFFSPAAVSRYTHPPGI